MDRSNDKTRIFSKGNMIKINGSRVIGKYGTGEPRKFYDKRTTNGTAGIKKILIDSTFVEINISVSDSPNIEMFFYGYAEADRDINFNANIENNELKIALKAAGTYYEGNLKLDITLPRKTFEAITVRSVTANITLHEGVLAEYIEIDTPFGNTNSRAKFAKLFINTKGGSIKLYTKAEKNIDVEIRTITGNVLTELASIGPLKAITKSTLGRVKNQYKGDGYSATMQISTMSGDITIRQLLKK